MVATARRAVRRHRARGYAACRQQVVDPQQRDRQLLEPLGPPARTGAVPDREMRVEKAARSVWYAGSRSVTL
jgi:hypothetical protein